jgi:hypothetical protein
MSCLHATKYTFPTAYSFLIFFLAKMVFFKVVKLQVLTAASLKFRAFWDVAPRSKVEDG